MKDIPRNLNRAVKKREEAPFFFYIGERDEWRNKSAEVGFVTIQALREKWVWQESSISLLLLPYFNKSFLVEDHERGMTVSIYPHLDWDGSPLRRSLSLAPAGEQRASQANRIVKMMKRIKIFFFFFFKSSINHRVVGRAKQDRKGTQHNRIKLWFNKRASSITSPFVLYVSLMEGGT